MARKYNKERERRGLTKWNQSGCYYSTWCCKSHTQLSDWKKKTIVFYESLCHLIQSQCLKTYKIMVISDYWQEFLNCSNLYIHWASLVAQLVKNLPTMQETWVQSLGLGITLEKGKATPSCILAWRIPWTTWSSWGHKELDITERLSLSYIHYTRALNCD